ncbi:MAG: hypothetical protein U0228_27210 [Myxococcaceae bacterium]
MADAADTEQEVARANATLTTLLEGSPIHGALRAMGTLVQAGLHCSACGHQVGGATDFSGEVGPTTGPEAARSLLVLLAAKCPHAQALVSQLG